MDQNAEKIVEIRPQDAAEARVEPQLLEQREVIQRSVATRVEEGKGSLRRYLLSLPQEQFDVLLETGASHESLTPEKRMIADGAINAADHDRRSHSAHALREAEESKLYSQKIANSPIPTPEMIPSFLDKPVKKSFVGRVTSTMTSVVPQRIKRFAASTLQLVGRLRRVQA